jgi:hypothetical protein
LVKKEKKKDDSIWNFLFGLGVGIVGYTVLSKLLKPKPPHCPVCNSKVQPKSPRCPVCKNELIWE